MGNKNRLRNTVSTTVLATSLAICLGIIVYDKTLTIAEGEEVCDAVDTTQKVSVVGEQIKDTINKIADYFEEKSTYKVGYVTEALKVREEPTEDSKVHEVRYLNDQLEYQEIEDSDYAKIKYNDTYAYVKKAYIAESEIIATQQETEEVTYTTTEEDNTYEVENSNYEITIAEVEEDTAIYSASYFKQMGVIYSGGWRWTWYSQNVLPGGGLDIPGRHIDDNGYICDGDDYICLASSVLSEGTIVSTPFGKDGKVYDSGCDADTLDVYVNF